MDNQLLKELLSNLAQLHLGHLELARKVSAIQTSLIDDVLDHSESRRAYQKYISQLKEIKKAHGEGAQRYSECEKALTDLRELMAEPAPLKLNAKRVLSEKDQNAHLGRRGVE